MNPQTPIFDIIKQFYDTFCIYKIRPTGSPLWAFSKKINRVKCYIWGVIYIENLILRTFVFEYFNNYLTLKITKKSNCKPKKKTLVFRL